MSKKGVQVSKHEPMELFLNDNLFRYIKINKTKLNYIRYSTCIQIVHFRKESKQVVFVPTGFTHMRRKTDADIQEHAVKGSAKFPGSWIVSGWIMRLSSCNHQSTVCMYATYISLRPQESNFTEKERGILQDRNDNVRNRKWHSSWNR